MCLYIESSFNATVNDKLCLTTSNIESLFVTVNRGDSKVNVGVIYRSPNGEAKEFSKELSHLASLIPKKTKSIILGDYNFNLLKRKSPEVNEFEDLMLSLGFFPLISIPTHSTSAKQHSCIDNIFINDIESVFMSGVSDDVNSHHKPIIAMLNLGMPINACQVTKQTQYYSFSKANVETLVQDLESKT